MDLSVVNGHFVPGVSEPCPSMGFTDQEIVVLANQIGKQAGQGQVKVFSVSEYNPAIEKFSTGTLLQKVFAAFMHGLNN
jgi:arginase family enzyme